jgi:hypothetical protein
VEDELSGNFVKVAGKQATKPAFQGVDDKFASRQDPIMKRPNKVEGLLEDRVGKKRIRRGPIWFPLRDGSVEDFFENSSSFLGVGNAWEHVGRGKQVPFLSEVVCTVEAIHRLIWSPIVRPGDIASERVSEGAQVFTFEGLLKSRDGSKGLEGIGEGKGLSSRGVPLFQAREERGLNQGTSLLETENRGAVKWKEGLRKQELEVNILGDAKNGGFEDPGVQCNKVSNPITNRVGSHKMFMRPDMLKIHRVNTLAVDIVKETEEVPLRGFIDSVTVKERIVGFDGRFRVSEDDNLPSRREDHGKPNNGV